VFCRTRSAFLEHERAKAELKGLMPEDAKEAMGHGIRANRSKSGAVKHLKYLAQIGFVSIFFDYFSWLFKSDTDLWHATIGRDEMRFVPRSG
jgi:hypothetical protein